MNKLMSYFANANSNPETTEKLNPAGYSKVLAIWSKKSTLAPLIEDIFFVGRRTHTQQHRRSVFSYSNLY
jgi:hypothetical protein